MITSIHQPNLKPVCTISMKLIIMSLLQVLFIETIHTFGLCLFLFRVLPCLDTVRCLLLMNALCSVPAILRYVKYKPQYTKLYLLVIQSRSFRYLHNEIKELLLILQGNTQLQTDSIIVIPISVVEMTLDFLLVLVPSIVA